MEIEIIKVLSIGGVFLLGYIVVSEWLSHLLDDEQKSKGEYQSGDLVDGIWTCPQCGSFNAKYLKRCGKCYNQKFDLLEGRTKEWIEDEK